MKTRINDMNGTEMNLDRLEKVDGGLNDFPLTGDPADMYKTFGVEIAKAAAEVERENLGALVKGPATGAVVGGQDH